MQIDYICLSRVSLRIAAGHSLKAVPPLRREARDDIPGGNPKTAIAGLFPLLHSGKSYNCDPRLVCAKRNTFQTKGPERLDKSGGGAAGVAFGRETRYKMKAQGKRSGR